MITPFTRRHTKDIRVTMNMRQAEQASEQQTQITMILTSMQRKEFLCGDYLRRIAGPFSFIWSMHIWDFRYGDFVSKKWTKKTENSNRCSSTTILLCPSAEKNIIWTKWNKEKYMQRPSILNSEPLKKKVLGKCKREKRVWHPLLEFTKIATKQKRWCASQTTCDLMLKSRDFWFLESHKLSFLFFMRLNSDIVCHLGVFAFVLDEYHDIKGFLYLDIHHFSGFVLLFTMCTVF